METPIKPLNFSEALKIKVAQESINEALSKFS